jgi:hypothetical protein
LYGIAKSRFEDFSPATMQFNSLDIKDNGKLKNRNTEPDVIIVGEKHWRGFMELYIEDQRIYRFSDDPKNLAERLSNQRYNAYLFKPDSKLATKFSIEDINRNNVTCIINNSIA